MSKCKHDATFGKIGSKYYTCLDCGKKVLNEDYLEDRKALEELQSSNKESKE